MKCDTSDLKVSNRMWFKWGNIKKAQKDSGQQDNQRQLKTLSMYPDVIKHLLNPRENPTLQIMTITKCSRSTNSNGVNRMENQSRRAHG